MTKLFMLAKILIVIAVLFFSFIFGRNIPFQDQLPLYESLRTTSAIIFGVMGAWIALICPEMLSSVISVYSKKDDDKYSRFKLLIRPMRYSTIILMFVLLIIFINPLVRQISFLCDYALQLRGFSFAILGLLTMLQLWSVLLTFIPTDFLETHMEKKKANQNMVDEYTKRNIKR